jgi:hypothetical protein
MKHRKLRIAWSVAWGFAAGLLVVLWVRSYWRADGLRVPTAHPILIDTIRGVVQASQFESDKITGFPPGWIHTTFNPDNFLKDQPPIPSWQLHWRSVGIIGDRPYLSFPIWSILVLLSFVSVAPWVRWRFTLRTLLVATTLVAVGLGLIVWLAR